MYWGYAVIIGYVQEPSGYISLNPSDTADEGSNSPIPNSRCFT